MTQPPAPLNAPKMSSFSVPLGATIITLLLVIAGSLGLVLFQVPLLEQSQELRGDASISNGEVFITTSPAATSKLDISREAKIDVQLNTQSKNISEIELVFNVITGVTDQVAIQTFSNYGLQVTQQEIEETRDGFLLSFKAKPSSGTTWSNTSAQNILSLVFTPHSTGTFKLAFDTDKSKAQTAEGDRLKTVGTLEYTVHAPLSSGKACNDTCATNNECQGNQRCYEGRCRLATNPTSSTCANPEAKTATCDQSCTSTAQCQGSLICHTNRCRRADNPESSSCVISSAAQQEAMRSNCNQPCTDNRGCSVNHRCYQGYCRLATNPGSLSCSSAKAPTVSGSYYQPKGGSQKGDEVDITPTTTATASAKPTPSPTSTASATISGRVTPTPRATISPVTSPLPTMTPTTSESLLSRLTQGSRSLLTLMLLGAGGLIVAIALLLLLSRLFNRRPSSSTLGKAQKSKNYEQELQTKIDQLKQGGPVPPAGPVPAGAPMPKAPIAPPTASSMAATSRPTNPASLESLTPPPSAFRAQPNTLASAPTPHTPVASPRPTTTLSNSPQAPSTDLSPRAGATAYTAPKTVTPPVMTPRPAQPLAPTTRPPLPTQAQSVTPLTRVTPPLTAAPSVSNPPIVPKALPASPPRAALSASNTPQLPPRATLVTNQPSATTPQSPSTSTPVKPTTTTGSSMLDRMKQRGITTPMVGANGTKKT